MREYPKPQEIYRHFKGNCYQVITLARSVEDKNLAYEVKVNYLLEEVEQLKKHVKELMKSA